jgi:hypothetical protein
MELDDVNPPEDDIVPFDTVPFTPNPAVVTGGTPKKKFVDAIDVGVAIATVELTLVVVWLVEVGIICTGDGGLAPLASCGAPVVGSRYQFSGGSSRHSPTVTS